jgi:hypothetical protein
MTIVVGSCALFARGPWRAATNLGSTAFYAAATVFVYQLLKPVSKGLSALAAFFSFAGCLISALAVAHLTPVAVNPLAIFGLHCLLVGYLIVRSAFLPRVVGALMMLAGIGWLTFLWPAFAASLAPFNMLPGILGESVLSVWLLVKGANVPRWEAQARG